METLRKKFNPPSMKLFEKDDEEERIWTVRESGLGATANVPGLDDTWPGWEDAAVHPEKLGDYLRDFRQLLDDYGYACSLYGHFGQGCVHVRGDEFIDQLKDFARDQNLVGSHFTAIGAFKDATLGYFDRKKMDYKKIPVNEQVEVLSLVGDIARGPEGEPKVHAHVVLGKADGTALGGHILEAHVWPTLELVLTESPRHMQRKHDEETGLALIDLEV